MSNSFKSKEFIEYFKDTAKQNEIELEVLSSIIKEAFEKTYLRTHPGENFETNINLKEGTINCFRNLVVVENEKAHNEDLETCLDDAVEILLDDARKINANAQIGDTIKQYILIDDFKSIEVGQIGSLLRQKITEIHNKRVADFWKPSLMKMIRAKVAEINYNKQRNEITGVKVELDDQWKTLGYLSRKDRIGDEKFKVGETYDFIIKEVKEQSRLWPVLLSRTEPELVEEILKREVVDIKNGNIEIKKIARIAGFKTKVAVSTNLLNIEPVAVVVGNKGLTITSISKQLNNERIDVIRYADDKRIFIANAIGLDKLKGLLVQENESGQRSAIAIVSKEDLPSVIGRGGANIRLIAKITEWNIDVKTIEQAFEENVVYEKFDEKIYRSWNIESINKKNVTNDEMLALIDNMQDEKVDENEQVNHQLKQQEKQTIDSNNDDSENDDEQLEYLEGFEDFKF